MFFIGTTYGRSVSKGVLSVAFWLAANHHPPPKAIWLEN